MAELGNPQNTIAVLQKYNFRYIIIHIVFNILYILKAIYGEIFHGVTVGN